MAVNMAWQHSAYAEMKRKIKVLIAINNAGACCKSNSTAS
jgi:hypothetical protein